MAEEIEIDRRIHALSGSRSARIGGTWETEDRSLKFDESVEQTLEEDLSFYFRFSIGLTFLFRVSVLNLSYSVSFVTKKQTLKINCCQFCFVSSRQPELNRRIVNLFFSFRDGVRKSVRIVDHLFSTSPRSSASRHLGLTRTWDRGEAEEKDGGSSVGPVAG